MHRNICKTIFKKVREFLSVQDVFLGAALVALSIVCVVIAMRFCV